MEGTTRFDRTDDDRSVGELVQQLSQQTATLIRQEMRLATAELQEKGKHAGIGAGMFGGAGLVALYGVGALIAAAIIGIGTLLEPWIAAVIVGVVLLAMAGILALTGKQKVDEATPPLPEQAIESAKRDVDEVRRRGRAHERAGAATPNRRGRLRENIERTRAELGETVEALAHKADVKARRRGEGKPRPRPRLRSYSAGCPSRCATSRWCRSPPASGWPWSRSG